MIRTCTHLHNRYHYGYEILPTENADSADRLELQLMLDGQLPDSGVEKSGIAGPIDLGIIVTLFAFYFTNGFWLVEVNEARSQHPPPSTTTHPHTPPA